MHLAPLIQDLAMILGVAGAVTLLFKKIKQPVVLGYVVAGMIIGPHLFPGNWVSDLPNIRVWADLGVIFLMLSLGLDFSFRRLAQVGFSASLTTLVEVSAMMVLGMSAAQALGFKTMDAVFLGAMVSISSTTVLIKAVDELKLKTRRFAQMIFGILIVEDLFAVLVLVGLSTFATQEQFSGMVLLRSASQLILVVSGWFLVGYFVVPRAVKHFGKAGGPEMLTVVSVALCFSLVAFSAYFHYSAALGAFIMGSILSESTESHQIEELMTPLKNLFAAVFFVSVGMMIDPVHLWKNKFTVLVFSLVVLFGKTISATIGSLLSGQTLRTAVQVGFGIAQIGEFSFIIAGLGMNLGVTSDSLYSIAVAVSMVTTFTTPYMIRSSHRFAVGLEKSLPARVVIALNQYAAWTQKGRFSPELREEFLDSFFKGLLNWLMVSLIFILGAEWAMPQLNSSFLSGKWVAVSIYLVCLLLSAPFLAALFGLFPKRLPLRILVRFFGVIGVSLLSAEFFPVKYVLLGTLAVSGVFFLLFYRQIHTGYGWLEGQFLSIFEEGKLKSPRELKRGESEMLRRLAPWDAHLVRLKVHPNSSYVLQEIQQSRLRSDHGINIVAIHRGLKTLIAPAPTEVILPKDELLVLGTDDRIEKVRGKMEEPPGLESRFESMDSYELRKIFVTEDSCLRARTIRECGIREKFGAMVVGFERGDLRQMNPDSLLSIEPGDVLWVVGETFQLDRLQMGEAGHAPGG